MAQAMRLAWPAKLEAREGDALVPVRGEPERNFRERLAALRGRREGQGDGEVRPLGEVPGLGQEVVHHARERRVGRPEAGGEEVAERAGDFGGDDGGDHGME